MLRCGGESISVSYRLVEIQDLKSDSLNWADSGFIDTVRRNLVCLGSKIPLEENNNQLTQTSRYSNASLQLKNNYSDPEFPHTPLWFDLKSSRCTFSYYQSSSKTKMKNVVWKQRKRLTQFQSHYWLWNSAHRSFQKVWLKCMLAECEILNRIQIFFSVIRSSLTP